MRFVLDDLGCCRDNPSSTEYASNIAQGILRALSVETLK